MNSTSPSPASDAPLYLFVDTNIFVHFRMYDEVNWLTVVKASEVILVMDGVVLGELDRFKDDSSNLGRRDRVRAVLAKFRALGAQGSQSAPVKVRDLVFIFPLMRSPRPKWDELSLDPAIADDRLIGSMIQFKQENQDSRVALVTNDLGPQLKSRGYGIEVVSPEGLIDRVEIASDLEKEVKKLRDENNRLKSREPKINVMLLQNGALTRLLKVKFPERELSSFSYAEVDNEIETKKRDYLRAIDPYNRAYPDHYEEFVKELDWYLDDYREFRERSWIANEALRFDVVFCVSNEGSASANIVEVDIDIKDAVFIVDSEEVPEWLDNIDALREPIAPTVPEPPSIRDQFANVAGVLGPIGWPGTDFPMPISMPPISVPSSAPRVDPIAWTEKGKVFIEIPNLKAGRSWCASYFSAYVHPRRTGGIEIE